MNTSDVRGMLDEMIDRLAPAGAWCQGEEAMTATGANCKPTNERARRWCVIGALRAAAESRGISIRNGSEVGKVMFKRFFEEEEHFRLYDITKWNDDPDTTQNDVLKFLRQSREELAAND